MWRAENLTSGLRRRLPGRLGDAPSGTATEPIVPPVTAPITEPDDDGRALADGGRSGPSDSRNERASGTTLLSGIGPIAIDVPAPGSLRGPGFRQSLHAARLLATLSTRAQVVPRAALPALAAGWAAAAGLVTTAVLLWLATGSQADFAATSLTWLAAHQAPVTTDLGTLTLLPLGLMAVVALPLRRAGRFVAAQAPGRAFGVGGLAVACYLLAAVAIALTQRTVPNAPALGVAWWTGLVAAAAGVWGIRRQQNERRRWPPVVKAVALIVAVPLAIGTVLVVGSLATGVGPVLDAQQAVAVSGADHVGLTLLQVAYLPNLVVWAGAFVVGAGFGIGGGQVLSPYSGTQPVLPDLPVLAAIPSSAPSWTALLPITVAVTGALAAVLLARRSPEPRLGRRIARVLMLAAASSVVWAVLGVLAGGGVGSGRLADLGPTAGAAVLSALLVTAGGLVWALLPTMAADARPVAVDLRARMTSRAGSETSTSA